jgi:hypothetical protein
VGIDTLVASVRAIPKPTVETLLNSVEEMSTNDVCTLRWFAITVARVRVNVNLRGLSFDSQVVRILASLAFFTDTGLEVCAKYRLGVLTFLECLLLDSGDRLEERLQ